jgi:hypothetical protein
MTEPQPQMPKMELKMMVMPLLFLFKNQIDLTDPTILQYVRIGLASMAVLALGTYFFIKQTIDQKNNQKKIWVPPKPPPSIPFLSPPSEGPPKPEEYTETTYHDHEHKLVMEALQGVVMSCGIAAVMSFKFGIHFSCLMQAVMVPVGLYENLLVQKYLLGSTKEASWYNELLAAPTPSASAVTEGEEDDDDVPAIRVEELDEEPLEPSSKKVPSGDLPSSDDDDTVKVEKSDANDID